MIDKKIKKYLKEGYPQDDMDKMFYQDNHSRLNKIQDLVQDIEDDLDSNAPEEWDRSDVAAIVKALNEIYRSVVSARKILNIKPRGVR